MSQNIAIVGMSCRYADASSPVELWESVLMERRAFRRIPAERLRLEDYFSDDRTIPDTTYSTQAAIIEGFVFDRVKFKVAGNTFRATDMAHWLALDTAAKAFEDADILKTLPKERTGVFLGNTLTGEFSRANNLRLRFPFVRRVVESVLQCETNCREKIPQILANLEKTFKNPFPAISEDSLAGGLSNTIAGRICNFFDLKGGGFTIDGACSSSLLAIANACSALTAGDVETALAGGVDLSLDPFELVGFAKNSALAPDMMRVYDARSNGFLPGEGCGFVLLMREEDAVQQNLRIYATIKGWGISSDGSGGITRPEAEGQILAFQRAYSRAGFDIASVPYFEGHGTGTAVGDETELKALSKARREAGAKIQAVIGSIKPLIGHTKAAAGVAGLLKATMVLQNEILPPTAGCEMPHPEISGSDAVLKTLKQAEVWAENAPLRAGVSSMGFGGINTHVVLERKREQIKRKFSSREKVFVSSYQDCELFLFAADSSAGLKAQCEKLVNFAAKISFAELGDLAVNVARQAENKKYRAALVVASPNELAEKLDLLIQKNGVEKNINNEKSVFYAVADESPKIGFLFSGQGSPLNSDGGSWRKRFNEVKEIYRLANLEVASGITQTHVAQPAIITASAAALRVLEKFDLTAQAAIGHSLGEIAALHWAGVFDENALLQITKVRGRAMHESSPAGYGAMLSVSAAKDEIEPLLQGSEIVIAGLNAPRQMVLSGKAATIEKLQKRLREKGIAVVRLDVSHAFHSPLVADSAAVLAEYLATENIQPLEKPVFSTITGNKLARNEDLRELLVRQITSPVRFVEAVENAEKSGIDLWIEVGTGSILRDLIGQITETPAIALEAGSESLKGLWQAVGAAFVSGQTINLEAIGAGRFVKPFDLDWRPSFFVNPCELAPLPSENGVSPLSGEAKIIKEIEPIEDAEKSDWTAIELITKLVAEHAELPATVIRSESRMLSDLHLNSITVGQIVTTAAKMLGAQRPLSPTAFADASVGEIAETLEKLQKFANEDEKLTLPNGIGTWIRPFRIELIEKPLNKPKSEKENGIWEVFAPENYPQAEKIKQTKLTGSGVIVCLSDKKDTALLLQSAQRALEKKTDNFVLVQHENPAGAFARTFALENPSIKTIVVNIPLENEKLVERIADEIAGIRENFVEAFYDKNGRRFEPFVTNIKQNSPSEKVNLSAEDVLVVTGGAKGITAECVAALAKETGVKLALLGTSKPENDTELANNLARFTAQNLSFKYFSANVTDSKSVQETIEKIEAEFGEITAVMHAAARNEPALIANLTEEKLQRTLAVKVTGAENLLRFIKPEKLKLFIAFGSIIARTGLSGESDYGLANEFLRDLTEKFQAKNPHCRCLTVEWSVWSSVGMGAKIANLEILERQGIMPIPLEKGVGIFLRLLKTENLPNSLVVMSRFPDLPTFKIKRRELPFLRFLEEMKVFYPNIELICDAEISAANDLYLEDHQVQGERLLPAVFGMEAIAQIASALLGETRKPTFQDLKFNRPIVVKQNEPQKIRIAALARQDGSVEVAVRCAETDFQINHFEGVCRFVDEIAPSKVELNGKVESRIEITPEADLYGKILFHRGRFRRVSGYRHLKAKECLAQIEPKEKTVWFSQFLPREFLLGDAAMRDAAMHSIQACIPQKTLLPVSVEKISIYKINGKEPCLVHAKEVSHHENTFTYNLEVLNLQGEVHEIWQGLRLQAVGGENFQSQWNLPLFAVYLERKIEEFTGAEVAVAFLCATNSKRRERSEKAIQTVLRENIKILYRLDGKPEVTNGKHISISHRGDLTLATTSRIPIACDIERIEARNAGTWSDLLGETNFKLAQKISQEAREDFHISATRIWSAQECLKKIGLSLNSSIILSSVMESNWVVISLNNHRIFSYQAQVDGYEDRYVLAIALCSE